MRVVLVADHAAAAVGHRLQRVEDSITVLPVTVTGAIAGPAADAEVFFSLFPGDLYPQGGFTSVAFRAVLDQAPRLRWVHSQSVGVEPFRVPETAARHITITNSAGIHDGPVAEMVLAFMLASAKRLGTHIRYQAAADWRRLPHQDLADATVGIVGLGHIGGRVAQICRAFGMRVVATKRDPSRIPVEVDQVLPPEALDRLLAAADFVVITVGSTPGTTSLINDRELRLLKPTAFLINVGRGNVIDEAALVSALREERVAGACLDVFAVEPLPSESPFYWMENVLITPHNAGSSPHLVERAIELFVDNYRLFVAGQPLRNVVSDGDT